MDSARPPCVERPSPALVKHEPPLEESEPRPWSLRDENCSFVEVLIHKNNADDRLGIDLRHVDERWEVMHIFRVGAVSRSNAANIAKEPPDGVLMVGDIIHA